MVLPSPDASRQRKGKTERSGDYGGCTKGFYRRGHGAGRKDVPKSSRDYTKSQVKHPYLEEKSYEKFPRSLDCLSKKFWNGSLDMSNICFSSSVDFFLYHQLF